MQHSDVIEMTFNEAADYMLGELTQGARTLDDFTTDEACIMWRSNRREEFDRLMEGADNPRKFSLWRCPGCPNGCIEANN